MIDGIIEKIQTAIWQEKKPNKTIEAPVLEYESIG
jgi:hypothetical protein